MDVLALTRELVGFNTVSANSNQLFARRLSELVDALGFELTTQVLTDKAGQQKLNLVARRSDQNGNYEGGLLLSGHMDTVPFRPDQKANLSPQLEGSRLYGRGTCDMKGGIAAILDAAERVKGQGLKAPLTLAFTCDEEVGCLGAKALIGHPAIKSRFAIIGEPTSLTPRRMHKGYYAGRITLFGRAAHSSDPAKGVSAIRALGRVLVGIEAMETALKNLPSSVERSAFVPEYATLNVGLVEGGTARNVIAESASFSLEVRPLPGQDMKKFFAQVEAVVAKTAGTVGARMKLELSTTDNAMVTPASSDVVTFLETWSRSRAGSISFSTEGKEFNQMGIESVIFGPGSIDKAHQEDEYVPIEELGKAADAYSDAIAHFCL